MIAPEDRTELASQMWCFNGIIENEQSPNEVQGFWVYVHVTVQLMGDKNERSCNSSFSDIILMLLLLIMFTILRIWIMEANQNT